MVGLIYSVLSVPVSQRLLFGQIEELQDGQ
jgi:hypothetical protein